MKNQDFSCDIIIAHGEDIDVAMATFMLTNNKRAFRLPACPLLLPVSKWLQVCICDFLDKLPDFHIDLFPEREGEEHPGRFFSVTDNDADKLIEGGKNTNTKRNMLEFGIFRTIFGLVRNLKAEKSYSR